jgi:cobalamin biosynthesis Mg chelatase CobN
MSWLSQVLGLPNVDVTKDVLGIMPDGSVSPNSAAVLANAGQAAKQAGTTNNSNTATKDSILTKDPNTTINKKNLIVGALVVVVAVGVIYLIVKKRSA